MTPKIYCSFLSNRLEFRSKILQGVTFMAAPGTLYIAKLYLSTVQRLPLSIGVCLDILSPD